MSMVFYDVSAAGSLANATLCAPAANEAPAARVGAPLAASAPRAAALAPQAACRAGWRRLLDALVSLVSGPTFERPHSGVSNI